MTLRAIASAALAPAVFSGCAPATSSVNADEIERLLIKDACTERLLTYGEGIDERNPEKISGVFSQDGIWTADGQVTVKGRDKFRALWVDIASKPRPTVGRHAISNIRFTIEDAGHASGKALIVMHRYNPDNRDEIKTLAAMMLVEVTMSCVRTEDESWRFDRMELESVSVADYTHGEG